MSSIDKTLDERGERYGEFTGHAEVTQRLKRAMGCHPGWRKLADDQREALEMTAHKIGRILNGDPNYIDSWHDIIGYVRLVEQRLEREQGKPAPATTPNDQMTFAFNAKPNGTLKDSAEAANTKKPLDFGAMLRDVLDGLKVDAEPKGKLGTGTEKPPLVDTCNCTACVLERNIRAMFPGAEIDVTFLSEDTGRTD